MNTAIGVCMETGMAGYIAIITGRIPAMAYRLQVRNYIRSSHWQGNRHQFRYPSLEGRSQNSHLRKQYVKVFSETPH